MADKLHRFLLEKLHVQGEWVRLDRSWKQVQATSKYPEPIRNLLGEALAAISLIRASLKFKGSLIMQMNETYPLNMLVVQAHSDGSIRGIARWHGKIDNSANFKDLLGDGRLIISVEQENADRYQSIIELDGNSLAEVLANYFQHSEQLDTHFILTANEDKAAGFMLQTLPTEDDKVGWTHALTLAMTVKPDELLTLEAQELFHLLYHEEDLRLYDAEEQYFQCSCSQEKVENMIYSLGKDEATSSITKQGNISIDCQFCNQHYQLDSIDVERIFTSLTDEGIGNLH